MGAWNGTANEIFLECIEISRSHERQAFLDRACGSDSQLRQTVEDLLRSHSEAGSFLEAPLVPVGLVHAMENRADRQRARRSSRIPGNSGGRRRLGDFAIVDEIARGGMGVVYEAEQISLGRRVALKVLPFAAMLEERQLRRFQNEARAAATLEHPHIVPVYGVGQERGVHYYAMKLIRGRSLAQLLAEIRQEAAPKGGQESDRIPSRLADELFSGRCSAEPPERSTKELNAGQSTASDKDPQETEKIRAGSTQRPNRSPEHFQTAARLALQAAEALDHAHGLGITHRDIKPANLLIDADGNCWITDFGLAHQENDPTLTHTGDLMGTARYMSPEQAAGQPGLVDSRADIYGLGTTLYELLTLQPAFTVDDRQQLLCQIQEKDPPPPRRADSAIPRDLETIVLKAIEKEPKQRYRTAGEMADDLRRFLDGEPIDARPVGRAARLWRWCRRNRGVACLISTIVLIVVFATVASAISAIRFRRLHRQTAVCPRSAKHSLI